MFKQLNGPGLIDSLNVVLDIGEPVRVHEGNFIIASHGTNSKGGYVFVATLWVEGV